MMQTMRSIFACLTVMLPFALMGACTDSGSDDEADEGGEVRACGEEWATKDGTTESIMDMWGAPCTADTDCSPLGENAVCVRNILEVYDLPGGYCSKTCELSSSGVSFELDSQSCSPDGGIACVGVKDVYTVCAPPCTSDSQCGREGYGCTIMPNIGADGDPQFCLMNSKDCCTTDSGECA